MVVNFLKRWVLFYWNVNGARGQFATAQLCAGTDPEMSETPQKRNAAHHTLTSLLRR
jgi:hypothetical protein